MKVRRPGADVLVVGAGPAGSVLAYLLAGLGWHVELLDRASFPRAKPCGECINPGGVRTLARLDLLDAVLDESPVPLDGWTIQTDDGHGGTGRFGAGAHGLGISREALDYALVRRAVARGVRLEEGIRVLRARMGPGGGAPLLETIDATGRRSTRTGRFVVGADGLRSAIARRLNMVHAKPGLRKISLTCRLRGHGPPRSGGFLHLSDRSTVGLAPVDDATASASPPPRSTPAGAPIAAPSAAPTAAPPSPRSTPTAAPAAAPGALWNGTIVVSASRGPEMKGNAEGFFRSIFDQAKIEWEREYDVVGGPWPSGAFDWPTRRTTGRGHLLVGDAAGYYDPLTGQGIYRALRSAELAAPAIDRCLRSGRDEERALREYSDLLERNFRPGRGVQRVIEGVVSRPGLREAFLKRVGATPGSLDALIRVTGDMAPVRSLLHPELLLSLAGVPGFHPSRPEP